jgi:predicted  nucleic acid-binding Zn-ribbon protein
MVMQEVEKLQSLQEVLSKFEVQNDIGKSQGASHQTELLSRMKKTFVDKSQEHRTKTQFVDELRKKSIEAEAAREKFEGQMDQIQTQREYEALDKEIKDSGEREQDLRRDLQKEEQLLGEMKVGLEKEEAMIHKQEEEVQKEQAKIKEALRPGEAAQGAGERRKNSSPRDWTRRSCSSSSASSAASWAWAIVPIDHGCATAAT